MRQGESVPDHFAFCPAARRADAVEREVLTLSDRTVRGIEDAQPNPVVFVAISERLPIDRDRPLISGRAANEIEQRDSVAEDGQHWFAAGERRERDRLEETVGSDERDEGGRDDQRDPFTFGRHWEERRGQRETERDKTETATTNIGRY